MIDGSRETLGRCQQSETVAAQETKYSPTVLLLQCWPALHDIDLLFARGWQRRKNQCSEVNRGKTRHRRNAVRNPSSCRSRHEPPSHLNQALSLGTLATPRNKIGRRRNAKIQSITWYEGYLQFGTVMSTTEIEQKKHSVIKYIY